MMILFTNRTTLQRYVRLLHEAALGFSDSDSIFIYIQLTLRTSCKVHHLYFYVYGQNVPLRPWQHASRWKLRSCHQGLRCCSSREQKLPRSRQIRLSKKSLRYEPSTLIQHLLENTGLRTVLKRLRVWSLCRPYEGFVLDHVLRYRLSHSARRFFQRNLTGMPAIFLIQTMTNLIVMFRWPTYRIQYSELSIKNRVSGNC